MARLKERYQELGLSIGEELPDHLSVVLRFLEVEQPGEERDELIGDCIVPALHKVLRAIEGKRTPYEAILRALLLYLRPQRGETELEDSPCRTSFYRFSLYCPDPGHWSGLYRYYSHRFTYSSLSSQLLENRQLFWGSVSWHYGITFILLAHLLPWLFPRTAAAVLSNSTRLLVLELSRPGARLLLRVRNYCAHRAPASQYSRARAVTSPMDWILLLVLAFQVLSGVGVALFERWGASWYLSTAVPWLWSLARLHPDTSTSDWTAGLIQAHILSGFVVILLFPFTRLVHVFAIPIEYLWRPYQVVIWNSDPHRVAPPPLPKPAVLRVATFGTGRSGTP